MTVPPVPGSGLIVIETKFVFGGFEAIFDGPAAAFYCNQLLRRRAFRTPSGEEGEFTVPDVAADQQASRPGSSQRAGGWRQRPAPYPKSGTDCWTTCPGRIP